MYSTKLLLIFFMLLSAVAFSQELNCKVSVNLDNIPISTRDLLSDFQQQVSDYMSKTHFSQDDWPYEKINCSMSIFMLTASNNGSFSAQVVVTSQRAVYQSTKNSLMLSINDPNWSFTYQKGQALLSNQSNFNPLVSLLDYYGFVILGFDADSWDLMGGTQYFSKAFAITNLASNSNYSKGWLRGSGYSRQGLVDDLLNDKYRPFRDAFYQYYYGIDIFDKNKQVGQQKIIYLIKALQVLKDKIDFNSVLLRTFFDAKSGEIVEYLRDYPDKSVFLTLIQIDPSHTAKYNRAMAN